MKTNALLAFFFFLVALFASTRANYVRDSEGRLIVSGGTATYYFVPVDAPNASIAGAAIQNPDGPCSLAVVEYQNKGKGNATKIESITPRPFISTDYDIDISFSPLPKQECTVHPVWLVAKDLEFGQHAVMVGSADEFPHPVSGRFFFRTDDPDLHLYHLVFCSGEPEECRPVTVKRDGYGNRRLIVAADGSTTKTVVKLVKRSISRVAEHISMVV